MFSAVAHKKVAGAEGYFVDHLSQNDYYAAGETRPGQWIGVGAERLGLSAGQEVTREQFYALCENRHPQTGERLTLRQNEKDQRRVFYDFTCSAPKSVSVLAVTMNDERLVQAHEQAVAVAFRELEAFAATRVRKHARQTDRTTGNLVAARFTHTASRTLDPQLHTHCTVLNATFDEAENSWKALQAGPLYEAIRYGTAVYRNELVKRVHSLGYRTIPARHGFEIEGVDEAVLQRFSQRSAQRDALVRKMEQKLGRRLSNDEIAYAVHHSRDRKIQGISAAEVRERQMTRLSVEEHSPFTFGQLAQIRRQRRADYRRVVELAAQHQTVAAFAELERLGCVIELDRDAVHAAATGAYLDALQDGRSALLVAPTWPEIEAVTAQVRTALTVRGLLGAQEHEFRVFDSLSWTEAQKRDPRQYRAGQVLRFHQAKGGFACQESVEVVNQADQLTVRREDASTAVVNPARLAPCFDVGERRTLQVAVGDKLLLQANSRSPSKFINGELVKVEAIRGETILLTDGRVIPPGYRTFTHGYALTSHAAQGKTVDTVFVVASSRSLPAVHREQFYVSVSRGRDLCRIFTDDKELLRTHVTHSSARTAAVEAIAKKRPRRLVALIQRAAWQVAETLRRLRQHVLPNPSIKSTPADAPAIRVAHSHSTSS